MDVPQKVCQSCYENDHLISKTVTGDIYQGTFKFNCQSIMPPPSTPQPHPLCAVHLSLLSLSLTPLVFLSLDRQTASRRTCRC